ncbi:MAG TPA: hypothetical protein VHR66_22440 [Gemmataceae bacterium]|nr:hypothetical protein [Gemmataceae bacterium]
MVDERTVLMTLGITLALGVLAIAYLREPLRRVLLNICRDRDHARFWAGSADVLLLTVPLSFELLLIDLGPASDSGLFWILHQCKWALLGLVAAVIVVAVGVMMLGRASKVPVWMAPDDLDAMNRLLSRVHEIRSRELVERLDGTRNE